MANATFKVYEIEHGGDVDAAVEDLRKAGCTSVVVLDTDFSAECMTVECRLPDGVLLPRQLKLEVACL